MKRLLGIALVFLSCIVVSPVVLAASPNAHGSLEEAKALVHKARAYIRQYGREKAFAEFDKRDGQFVDRDLYIYVYDKSLRNLAHGGNPKLIGKDLHDLRDSDGKYLTQGLLAEAMKGGGTYDYRFLNPVSGKVEKKVGYVEMEGDLMVGSGIYKGE